MESETYPCEKCGKPGHVALDGTPFSLCWDCLRKDRHPDSFTLQSELLTGLCAEIEALKAERDAAIERASRAVENSNALGQTWEALKAERDELKKQKKFQPPLLADLLRAQIARQSVALRALNKGIHRLRKGRDNAIKRALQAKADSYVPCDCQLLRAEVARLEAELAAAKAEIATDDQLLAQRQRLVELFECPVHGQCIPYVIEQVEKLKARVAQLKPNSVHSLPPPPPPLHPSLSSPIPTLHTDSPPVKCPGSTS